MTTPPRFLAADELAQLGLAAYGTQVLIDRSAILICPERMLLGNRVRIDAYSLIIAGEEGISIGSNVHVGAGVQLFGSGAQIRLEDFAGLSPRVTLLTASDDFRDGHLTGPTVPLEFRHVTTGAITLGKHALVGAGSVVLPGISLGWGAAVGALSLVHKPVADLTIVFGSPAKPIGMRPRDELSQRESAYLSQLAGDPTA